MQITAIIHTHGKPDVTLDTIDSVKHYMTNQVLLLVDEAGWNQFDFSNIDFYVLKGFYHGYHKAPYRNIILGLLNAAKNWPESDWYCYLEYDCLIGSSAFRNDLAQAGRSNVWLLGNDYRDKQTVKFPLVELMLRTKFNEIVYLLGAVLFYHKNFVKKLLEENFFEKFLFLTNDFRNGFFPGYTAWDLIEHLMPTLAKHWGGEVRQFAKWSNKFGWVGNYRRYPIRWQPEILPIEEEYISASILHPLKSFDHEVRQFCRERRNRCNLRKQ